MVFSSLFFVFFFLPINLFLYYKVDSIKKQNIVMLISSLIFYSWNGPKYLVLITGMTFVSWISAICIEKYPLYKKTILMVGIGILLVVLGIFKYTGFFLDTFNFISPWDITVPNIILPIGISFYTFQLLSYIVDVYRGDVKAQQNYWWLLLYASLFHQCIAGPIVRYQDVENDITSRKFRPGEIKRGINRFCIGLAKKAILANGIAKVADANLLIGNVDALKDVPVLGLWVGIIAYALQIYFDFSAYSDMAIGMGLMTGFHYKENFDYPYISQSVSEFWRRWHISLGTFFRDYVYIPLGGNRSGNIMFNLFIVWFLTGMWHGASWNYILWGLYYFGLISLEKKYLNEKLKSLPNLVGWFYTICAVNVGWILFKFENLKDLFFALIGMIGLNGNSFSNLTTSTLIKNNIFLLIFCIFAALKGPSIVRGFIVGKVKNNINYKKSIYAYDAIMPAILLLLSLLALIGNSYNPFLYFQF